MLRREFDKQGRNKKKLDSGNIRILKLHPYDKFQHLNYKPRLFVVSFFFLSPSSFPHIKTI